MIADVCILAGQTQTAKVWTLGKLIAPYSSSFPPIRKPKSTFILLFSSVRFITFAVTLCASIILRMSRSRSVISVVFFDAKSDFNGTTFDFSESYDATALASPPN